MEVLCIDAVTSSDLNSGRIKGKASSSYEANMTLSNNEIDSSAGHSYNRHNITMASS